MKQRWIPTLAAAGLIAAAACGPDETATTGDTFETAPPPTTAPVTPAPGAPGTMADTFPQDTVGFGTTPGAPGAGTTTPGTP